MIDELAEMIQKLIESSKLQKEYTFLRDFELGNSQLTGWLINQAGDRAFTSGYDMLSKVWSVETGELICRITK